MAKNDVLIKWTGGRQFVGTDSGNHSIVISSHDENNHTGVKPSELMLMALGSCSAYDVVAILEKKRLRLQELGVSIQADQDPEPPWTYRSIRLHYRLVGQLDEKAVDQAIALSLDKYCSVAATLSGVADIQYTYELKEG
jgi:putative redox protein